jgi:hypothetical protein
MERPPKDKETFDILLPLKQEDNSIKTHKVKGAILENGTVLIKIGNNSYSVPEGIQDDKLEHMTLQERVIYSKDHHDQVKSRKAGTSEFTPSQDKFGEHEAIDTDTAIQIISILLKNDATLLKPEDTALSTITGVKPVSIDIANQQVNAYHNKAGDFIIRTNDGSYFKLGKDTGLELKTTIVKAYANLVKS